MKKVFSNSSDVIHLFAQRTQSEARCENVYFENDSIYSYGSHYELGRFITNSKKELAILIEDRGYSVTTAKHINQISMATKQYRQFYCSSTKEDRVLSFLEEALTKLQTARKKELYVDPALAKYRAFMEWVEWSGEKIANKRRLNLLVRAIQGGSYLAYLVANEKRIKREKASRERKELALFKAELAEFYAYERDYIYHGQESYVRLSKDGLSVETSQRVSVPIKEAKTLYSLIVAGNDIKGFAIGGYTVIGINGVLKVGCHSINIESMHRTGKLL